jgi:hypothetical protein
MMDIVQRLRRWVHDVNAVSASDLMDEAAATIESLRGCHSNRHRVWLSGHDNHITRRESAMMVTDLASRYGKRLLKKIAKGREEWRLVVLPRNEWRVAFIRDVDVESSVEVVTSERVNIERPSRSDRDVSEVECCGVWLTGSDVATAASLLLSGWRLRIRHDEGSELSRELKMQLVEFVAVPPLGAGTRGLAIGGVTLVDCDWKRTVISGACSTSNRR